VPWIVGVRAIVDICATAVAAILWVSVRALVIVVDFHGCRDFAGGGNPDRDHSSYDRAHPGAPIEPRARNDVVVAQRRRLGSWIVFIHRRSLPDLLRISTKTPRGQRG
jgi:hypothetical protein